MNRSVKIYFLFLIVILIAPGCKKSIYPGYTKHEDGFYYKLIKIGDEGAKCAYNDFVTVSIAYKTMKDSIIFKGSRNSSKSSRPPAKLIGIPKATFFAAPSIPSQE